MLFDFARIVQSRSWCHRRIIVSSMVMIFIVLVMLTSWSFAMEANLARPYGTDPSPPHNAKVVFYSKQNDTLLFDRQPVIELYCRVGSRCVGLNWTLARNTLVKPFATGLGEALPANTFVIRIPTEKLYAGFYDVRVKIDSGIGKPIEGICTFGLDAGKMSARVTRPADFAEFWQRGKAELSKIPLATDEGPMQIFKDKEIDAYNLEHAALPGNYDPTGHRYETVEAGKVSFASVSNQRVHGFLAKPQGTGPFPAMLVLPGAGINARPMPLEHARHGYLALDIQVHGDEVDLAQYPKHPGYYDDYHFEPVDSYYFRNVYLHVEQALNYLASRKDVDLTRIVVVGGSQGGRLCVVAAALDKRVAAIVPAIPNSGHHAFLTWQELCNACDEKKHPNPALAVDGMDVDAPPMPVNSPENRCIPYYDILNFAPDVQCPVFMNVGLIDPVSPPSSVMPVFNSLGSKNKTLVPLPGLAHDWSGEFDRSAWRWLDRTLGNR